MRADRLLSIMLHLQVHRRVTARQLAKKLEVSERTIHRDMLALSVAGIPVFAERGAGGGWSLMEEYKTNLTGLNRSEVEALFLTQSRLLADLGLEQASRGALTKLLAAIPSMHRDRAEFARQRIYVDASGWNRSDESIEFLPIIQQAVWGEKKLRIKYLRGSSCEAVERIVEPLGLVAKGSVWYLVASVDGDIRSYRVSRISEAVATEERFSRPKDFDLSAYWKSSTTTFKAKLPSYQATFRADPEIVPKMHFAGLFARVEKIEQETKGGWQQVTMTFQFEEEACQFALGFGPKVEVIEPASLRLKVIEAARETVAFYEEANRTCSGRAD